MFFSKKLKKFENIKHCFFSRKNGFSKGYYLSLNCGLGSGDKKGNVLKNLDLVSKKIGILERANILSEKMTFKEKANMFYRLKRLMNYSEMGNLFKVLFAQKKGRKFSLGF